MDRKFRFADTIFSAKRNFDPTSKSLRAPFPGEGRAGDGSTEGQPHVNFPNFFTTFIGSTYDNYFFKVPQNKTLTDPVKLAAQLVNSTDRHLFLTGKAGTGKTTFLRDVAEATHKNFVIVAPTGIAALNAKGVTIHSQFLLPFGSFLPERNAGFDGDVQGAFSPLRAA